MGRASHGGCSGALHGAGPPRRRGRWCRVVVVLVAVAAGIPAISAPPAANASEPCTGRTPGGDWARYGRDLEGTQRQTEELDIGPGNVDSLVPAWTISGTADYQNAPVIVSGGCLFLTTGGSVVAYRVATGEEVWRTDPAVADATGAFAVTVVDGRVHVALPSAGHPRAAAFDVRDGRLLWISDEVSFGYVTNQLASAVVHDGIQVLFTTGPDFDPAARQGYALIDATTGRMIHAATTIPDHELAKGYAGGGVWGTPNVDTETGYLYVGTSNPESKTREHAYDNAVLKIDLDRTRPTFGSIVGSYKGTPDSYTGYDNPVCQTLGNDVWVDAGAYGASPLCGQLDVDFGNGPSLWRTADGRVLGAATQKSGVLHVFDATTMEGAWSRLLAPPLSFLGGNIARTATDGELLYVLANPGVIWAFEAATGDVRWVAAQPGVPMTGGNLALANGVVYLTADTALVAYDAATGEQLWTSELSPTSTIMSSVVVAGHHVIANRGATGQITGYRLPDGSAPPGAGGGAPSTPELDLPDGDFGTGVVVAGPGASTTGYATPLTVVLSGGSATFINADTAPHDVISRDGSFRSDVATTGGQAQIRGVEELAPGDYGFFCSIHPNMTGMVTVL